MMGTRSLMLVSSVVVLMWTSLILVVSSATLDEKECSDQLQNLASCIPYVSGSSKKPTPQCCQEMEGVRSKKPKCLCVLIKQSTDPSMPLPINTTLALQMPSACNIPANISDCPRLLKLSPDSPDAKIFKQASAAAAAAAASSSTSPSSSSSSSSPGKDSKVTPNNAGGRLSCLVSVIVIGVTLSFACIVV